MRVRAKRGVCIGPGRHLAAGDIADIDTATVQFLVSIGAVEAYSEQEPADEAIPEPKSPPKKGGKEK